MPVTITKTAYQFAELSEKAKKKARDWMRSADSFEADFEDFEDFENVAAILGIEFKQRQIPLMSGKTRSESAIFYSGFSSQGDGACFEGSFAYAKGMAKKIRDYAPKDETLHNIADRLAELQRKNFYRVSGSVSHSGHYYHRYCTSFDVVDSRSGDNVAADVETEMTEIIRDFMLWIYRQLESEYEYRMSDEAIDETIAANEYLFDEDGNLSS